MHIVVIMDGPETVNPETDTTYSLILAAEEREHRTWHCHAGDIELNEGRVWARAERDMASGPSSRPGVDVGFRQLTHHRWHRIPAALLSPEPPESLTQLFTCAGEAVA